MEPLHILGTLAAAVTGVVVLLIVIAPRPRKLTESEKHYRSATSNVPQRLCSIFDEANTDLTIIIPAYNEKLRLPVMLDEAIMYLEERKSKNKKFTYEILIVDDASTDGTSEVALDFGRKYNHIDLKVLRLEKNRRKGGAITQGILSCSGNYILFADADGATKFSDLRDLENELKKIERDGYGVAVGSRAHLVNTDVVVKRSFIRNFLMHSFHKVLFILGIRSIADTQCGFKLFTRKSAQKIFHNMHVEGWIFDIEVLLIAQYFNMPIVEVPVNWHEVDGSKVSLTKDSIQMAKDLLVIRLSYLLRLWKIRDPLAREKQE
ncbi:10927_t:CDS:2 [Paraglomus occultum]|uniref:dolichyl-phosphate beta-glucosyltransferase n=1 Tax=Paraglomus occultum TaxID=144539 RepID=A0A9N9FLZ2_9GLOM|nr:10927_t:CDS:2 [Paraglomus occultum]